MFGIDLVPQLFSFMKEGYSQIPETLSYLWKFAITNPLALKFTGWAGGFNLSLTSFRDIEIYARGVASVEMTVFLKLFDQMVNYDGLSVAERIQVPTLIIGGALDSVTSLRYQKALHNKIPGSELLVVPYGSHSTQLDMPDFVNLRLEKFLLENGFDPIKKERKSFSRKSTA